MQGNARIDRISQYSVTRRWLNCVGIIAVAVAFGSPRRYATSRYTRSLARLDAQ